MLLKNSQAMFYYLIFLYWLVDLLTCASSAASDGESLDSHKATSPRSAISLLLSWTMPSGDPTNRRRGKALTLSLQLLSTHATQNSSGLCSFWIRMAPELPERCLGYQIVDSQGYCGWFQAEDWLSPRMEGTPFCDILFCRGNLETMTDLYATVFSWDETRAEEVLQTSGTSTNWLNLLSPN